MPPWSIWDMMMVDDGDQLMIGGFQKNVPPMTVTFVDALNPSNPNSIRVDINFIGIPVIHIYDWTKKTLQSHDHPIYPLVI